VAEEELNALKERRLKVRELELSREKILARYRNAAPDTLEKAERSAAQCTMPLVLPFGLRELRVTRSR
jgi:hypothetical protein